jgi:hypothetical protein
MTIVVWLAMVSLVVWTAVLWMNDRRAARPSAHHARLDALGRAAARAARRPLR